MRLIFLIPGLIITSFLAAQNSVSIFNGKDLDGWTIHGTEKWYVENGKLVCESGPDKQYGYLLFSAMGSPSDRVDFKGL